MARGVCMIGMALLLLAGSAGCVERRFVITSEPFGAVVYDERDMPIAAAPADKAFTYYGTYRFKLIKDGYQTKVVEEHVRAPWYEWPLLDFISENVIPFTIRDVRHFHYRLDPIEVVPAEKVRGDGEALRQRGQTVGPQMVK